MLDEFIRLQKGAGQKRYHEIFQETSGGESGQRWISPVGQEHIWKKVRGTGAKECNGRENITKTG